ncbi:MAG: hypothetical protein QXP27_09395 [Candidatus Methanomethyliaceae archaeon]
MQAVFTLEKKLSEHETFCAALESFSLLSPEWRETVMFDLGGAEAVIEEVLGGLPDNPEELEILYQAVNEGLDEAIKSFLTVPDEMVHAELRSAFKRRELYLSGLGKFWDLSDEVLAQEFKERIKFLHGGISLVLSEEDPLGSKTASIFKAHWSEELKMDLSEMPFVTAAALAAVTNADEPPVIKDLRGSLGGYYDRLLGDVTPKALQYLEQKTGAEVPDYLGHICQKILAATGRLQGAAGAGGS